MGFQCRISMTEMGDSLLRTNIVVMRSKRPLVFQIKIIVVWIRMAVKVGEWLDFGSIL